MRDLASSDILLGIAVMTAVTVAMRWAGFWLMRYVKVTPRVQRMLDALPGSIIVATIFPAIVKGGLVPAMAIGTALAVMIVTRRDILAVVAGALVAAAARAAGVPG
jgi:uncharacterized membrane protein